MVIKYDFYTLINFLGFINGFLFAIIVLVNKKKYKSVSYTFSFLLLILSIQAAGSFASYANLFTIFPHIQKTFSPFYFLLGPALLFYYRSLLLKNINVKAHILIHFIPFILNILYNMPFYIKSNTEKIAMLSLGLTMSVKIIRIFAVISYLIYFFIIFNSYKKHQICNSNTKFRLKNLVLVIIAIFTILFINSFPKLLTPIFKDLTIVWESLIILFIIYNGLTQEQIFFYKEKEEKKVLNSYELDRYYKNMNDFIEKDKTYLDPDLTLNKFSKRFNLSSKECSFVINRKFKQNFFNFINSYRVKYFKTLCLKNSEDKNILNKAFESGFSSKSTFNTCFKKIEGKTPREFIKRIK